MPSNCSVSTSSDLTPHWLLTNLLRQNNWCSGQTLAPQGETIRAKAGEIEQEIAGLRHRHGELNNLLAS